MSPQDLSAASGTRPVITSAVLVLDSEYGPRLEKLLPNRLVWVADSMVNRAAAEGVVTRHPEFRKMLHAFEAPFPMGTQEFLALIATIDLHQTKHGYPPPTEVEVVGHELFPDLHGALLEYGFKTIEESPSGFRASRPSPSGQLSATGQS